MDKVLHGDGAGQGKAQAAAQEAAFTDAEATAYGGVTPKAKASSSAGPSGEPEMSWSRSRRSGWCFLYCDVSVLSGVCVNQSVVQDPL